ncbi:MAG TPA: ribbon-helix-helix protein, CopG family [Streptosporangiaceae bacterium]|nr:ribbon-helix-helix protein, CopG family [Streptosporangiaceae bacterium]
MTEKRKRGRPATGETPQRGVRVDEATWNKAAEKAAKEGRSVSDVIRDCLDSYVADDDR